MDNNKRAFFELIKAGLWGEADANLNLNANDNHFEGVEWEKIYKLAQEQSVQGLVLQGIETVLGSWLKVHGSSHSEAAKPSAPLVPKVLLLQWIGEVQIIEQKNRSMNAFIAELIEKLRKADIYALLVKGQGIAQCYEKPLWRCSGDVDLLLSYDNYQKAKTLLIPFASEVESEYEGISHLGMTIDGWVVELHGSLRVGLPQKINRVLDEIQADTFYGGNVRSWLNGQTQIFMLGKENDIVYVFVHFFNHFYKEGVGLRQICDWCRLMWTYRDSMDRNLIEKRVTQMGLVSEWKAFSAYAVEYLGMSSAAIPMYDSSSKWVRKAHLINRFILRVGNMGHNRDMSHFSTKPYFVRKCISMGRRTSDLINHARIFPLDSLRFFPQIMYSGMRSAMRGEG